MIRMKVSIRMAVLTVLVLSILVTSMLVMYTISDKFNDKLQALIINDIENVVQNCTEEINSSVFRAQEANDLLRVDEDFIKLLKSYSEDSIENVMLVSRLREYVNDVKSSISTGMYGYSSYFFVDLSQPITKLLEGYNNKRLISDFINVYSTDGLEKKLWYQELMASKQQMCIFEDEAIPQYVFLAQVIKNGVDTSGEVLGISLVGIDFQNILRNYGNIENKEFLQIMIVNNANEVICTNDESITDEVMEFASYYKSNDSPADSMSSVTIDGKEYYACMYELDFDMTLVAAIPREDIFITVQETTREVYVIVLIVLVAVLIITVLLSGVIVSPIKKLSDFMQTQSETTELPDNMKDSHVREIDSLYKAYDSMIDRIRNLLVTAQNLGEQKKETEFRMLQAQINPHYLYNALDSIAWMALRKGEEDIADMASSLADSFRYNARTSEMIIDFKSEIEFIKNYVKLQEEFRKISFPLEVDIPEEVLKLKVPKFMLQPLVENAIIHGLKHDSNKLQLRISASIDDDLLHICTEDNGAGFDADSLNRYLDGDDTVFDTEKIGIINIHKRLKNKYGERAGLRYATNELGGLTAMITLPLEEGEKEIEIF